MFFIIALISPLLAGDLQFTASLDRNELGINETCVYNLTVSGENINDLPQIRTPSFEGFSVANRSQSTQIQFINGRSSQSRTFSFVLIPQKQGTLTIEKASFQFSGKTYTTDPLNLKVGPAVAQTAQKPTPQRRSIESMFGFSDDTAFNAGDIRVDMQIGKRSLYVGEKTVLSFMLYHQGGFFGQPQYIAPKVTNFLLKSVDKGPVPSQKTINGRTYQCQTIRQIASPLSAGKSIIPPASLAYATSPFGGAQRADTKPIEVQVKKLPDNAPDDFSGAVGNFKWTVTCDKTKTTNGSGYVLKINIFGTGNLDPVNTLGLESMSSTFFYLNKINNTESIQGDIISVTKYLEYLIVAQKTGKLTIPELTFCYFDPNAGIYRTLSHQVPDIEVTSVSDQPSSVLPAVRTGSLSMNGEGLQITVNKNSFVSFLKFIFIAAGMLLFGILGLIVFKKLPSLAVFERKRLLKELEALKALSGPELSTHAQRFLHELCHRRYGIVMKGLSSQKVREACLKLKIAEDNTMLILSVQENIDSLRFSPVLNTTLKEKIILQLRDLIA